MAKNKKLNIIQIAISLVSLHYGLGFLFGTTESVYKIGIKGITYAFMCAVGLFLLALFTPFYFKKKLPIWDLLQIKYGDKVKNLTVFLSWFWMIGVAASQIISTTSIFNLIGFPTTIALVVIIVSISLISLLPLEKLAKVLFWFLITSSGILSLGIFTFFNSNKIFQINLDTFSFSAGSFIQFLSIAVPTILITILGMDFHQFIIKGKNVSTSIKATILAGFILTILTFIPMSIALGAKYTSIVPQNIDGKQLIPYITIMLGGKIFGPNLKYILLPFIAVTAIGSSSCLIRIMTQTFQSFNFIPYHIRDNKKKILLVNGLIIFLLSIKNDTIISLIVSFYIVYIVGVFIPFMTILLPQFKKNNFSKFTIFSSMFSGITVSLITLILSKLELIEINYPFNLEFVMISFGMVTSLITLISDKICQALLPRFYKFHF